MKKELTKREKVLIIVVCVVIFVAAYFMLLLSPTMDALSAASDKNADLESQSMDMQMLMAERITIDDSLAKAKASIAQSAGKYEAFKTQNDIVEFVRGFNTQHNLDAQQLILSDARVPVKLTSSEKEYKEVLRSSLSCGRITGDLVDFYLLIDDIARSDNMRATNLSISYADNIYSVNLDVFSRGKTEFTPEQSPTEQPPADQPAAETP